MIEATLEIPMPGNCPRVNIFQNFDVSRFFGKWYEICAYPNKLTLGGKCVYTTFSWQQNNGITVYSRQITIGKEKQYLGSATVVANAVLGVTYPAYRNFNFKSFCEYFYYYTMFYSSAKANAYYNILGKLHDYDY